MVQLSDSFPVEIWSNRPTLGAAIRFLACAGNGEIGLDVWKCGEAAWLEDLMSRTQGAVRRILRHYKIPVHEAEDLLQESLLILVRKRDIVEYPDLYLAATLSNRCVIYWRRHRRRGEVLVSDASDLERLAGAQPPSQASESMMRDLWRFLERKLSPHQAKVFWWHFGLGMGTSEIAQRLSCDPSSVRQTYGRGMKRIAQRLEAAALKAEVSYIGMSDGQWSHISIHCEGYGRHSTPLRAIVDAIHYKLSRPCSWKNLPPYFPHYGTVRYYFRIWYRDGTWSRILGVLSGSPAIEPCRLGRLREHDARTAGGKTMTSATQRRRA